MSDLRAAAQQALEAIDRALPHAPHCGEFDALADMADALRAALAERDREPLADEQLERIVGQHVRITDHNLSGAVYMAMRDLEAVHGIEERA